MDLTAGAVILTIGIDAARQVRTKEQALIAALPIVFGTHQLIETLVWWHLQGKASDAVGAVATFTYLFIAVTLVPILVPVAFLRLGVLLNKALAWSFVACGVAAGLVDLWALGRGPVHPMIMGRHIMYPIDVPLGTLSFVPYLIAACGPPLFSRSSLLRAFGVANLGAVAAIAWLARDGMISLWCVWAAVTSFVINLHLRRTNSIVSGAAAGSGPAPTALPG